MASKVLLTKAEETFVAEYLKNGNASAAYRAAFPQSKRWKDASVHVKASQLLGVDKVQIRISALRAQIAKEIEKDVVIEQTHVMRSAERALHADYRKLFTVDDKGERRFVQPEHWPDNLAMAIDSMKVKEVSRVILGSEHGDAQREVILTEVIDIKLSSRAVARDQLAKHTGFYERDNEQQNPFRRLPRAQLRELEALLSELEAQEARQEIPAPTEVAVTVTDRKLN